MENFKSKITLYPQFFEASETCFDDIVVNPVKSFCDDEGNGFCEQCEPDEADFYSVYIHLPNAGLSCIADCDTEQTANQLVFFMEAAAKSYIPEL